MIVFCALVLDPLMTHNRSRIVRIQTLIISTIRRSKIQREREKRTSSIEPNRTKSNNTKNIDSFRSLSLSLQYSLFFFFLVIIFWCLVQGPTWNCLVAAF
ncbi:dedicator of cytokinesis protein 9 [Sarcoptes scabiei]|nr:dedicator of cytokinesis protein 9 [Sarcoptes scabiei]